MSTYSGYSVEKSTSRVLNPPGGRSNNIFGVSEEPLANKTNQAENGGRKNNISNIFGDNMSANESNKVSKDRNTKSSVFFGGDEKPQAPPAHQQQQQQPPQQQQQQQYVAPSKSKRTGFNPITGKSYDDDETEENKKKPQEAAQPQQPQPQQQQGAPHQLQHAVHTSTRVNHPPGGHSTKLW